MNELGTLGIRVRLMLAKGLIGDAIDALQSALQTDPNDAGLWFMLGVAEEDRNQLAGAAQAFDRAAAVAGRFAPQYSLRANLTRTLDHALDPTVRLAAGRQAADLLATNLWATDLWATDLWASELSGADPGDWTEAPEWDRYRDHIRCLRDAPLDHYQRTFMAMDPVSGAPMGVDAAWYFRADGQLSPSDRTVLDSLTAEIARPGLRVVEIGSAAGRGSTRIFGAWIKRLGGELICVDPWAPIYNADAYDVFLRNLHLLDLTDIVSPLRTPSREAAARISDGSCDLVFIDGDHRYDAVRDDIALWHSKVKPDGLLCGDDCEGRSGDFDLAALSAQKNNDASPILRIDGTIQQVHCGVVLAVAEALDGTYEVLGDPPGIWLTRRARP